MKQEEAHVGALSTFDVGVMRIVEIGSRQIGILRSEGDVMHAVLNICPHKGAPVCKGPVGGTMLPSKPGELIFANDGKVLKCPWHGYEFHLKTGVHVRDAKVKLKSFPVTVKEGGIYVTA